jgi:hypothetical protein
VRSLAIVPVRERMKTCLFRRLRASSSVAMDRMDRGPEERMLNEGEREGEGVMDVIGGRREVRNEPIEAMVVSDWESVQHLTNDDTIE